MIRSLILCLSLAVSCASVAQSANDECVNAIPLGRIENYCSQPGEFTNVGGSTSAGTQATCFFDTLGADVWFSFIATATDLSARVVGSLPRDAGGTISAPEFAVYVDCSNTNEIGCSSDAFGVNVTETFIGDLIPGNLYFIKVQAREGITGTFQLCLEMFDNIPEPQSDCPDGVILCDKSPFTVNNLIGAGSLTNEVQITECIREEFASVWYRWTCDQAGSLAFTLTPNNPVDDLDFAVYELPGGIDDCANKQTIRCMASGANTNQPLSEWERCSGQTGLRLGEPDQSEDPGCDPNDNNFVDGFQMVSGRSYALIVNNFSNTGNGFSIVWGGDGTFVGPDPSFVVDPEIGSQCDVDELTFTSTSSLTPGSTGVFEWFFGNYASQTTAAGEGPHNITYAGFGEKTITLRVTSSEGCVVSESRTIFIEPCCPDPDALQAASPILLDPICPGTATGIIDVPIAVGEPDFSFSLDGGPYLPTSVFPGQFAGEYTIFVQNIKGCNDTVDVELIDPPNPEIEVGDNLITELGEPLEIISVINPPGNYTYTWSGVDSIRCLNPECSEVEVFSYNPSELVVTAINDAGCATSDLLQIDVRKVRPLYAPNAFSPNGDGVNDTWIIYGNGNVVSLIRSVQVYDRWGSLLWEAQDVTPGDVARGWNGQHKGKRLNPGVFAFYAEVEYVDGIVLPVTGDINLMR